MLPCPEDSPAIAQCWPWRSGWMSDDNMREIWTDEDHDGYQYHPSCQIA
ncbi:hypothetical protein ABZ671_27370 [Micromonospora sp. NPDC006766]